MKFINAILKIFIKYHLFSRPFCRQTVTFKIASYFGIGYKVHSMTHGANLKSLSQDDVGYLHAKKIILTLNRVFWENKSLLINKMKIIYLNLIYFPIFLKVVLLLLIQFRSLFFFSLVNQLLLTGIFFLS